MHQVQIVVTGKVQGVNYRYAAKEEAQKLALTGWVKNLDDGNVKLLVQGEQSAIKQYIAWCKEGSEFADVEDIQFQEQEISEDDQTFTDFKIEY